MSEGPANPNLVPILCMSCWRPNGSWRQERSLDFEYELTLKLDQSRFVLTVRCLLRTPTLYPQATSPSTRHTLPTTLAGHPIYRCSPALMKGAHL